MTNTEKLVAIGAIVYGAYYLYQNQPVTIQPKFSPNSQSQIPVWVQQLGQNIRSQEFLCDLFSLPQGPGGTPTDPGGGTPSKTCILG